MDADRKAAAALDTPTDLSADAVDEMSAKLNEILATTFALYLKTKISIGTSAGRISATTICSWMNRRSRFSAAPTKSPSGFARSAE
jgi:hypothetical protein